MPAKFLVLWKLEISRLDAAMMAAVLRQQEHAVKLREAGKLVERYHVVGTHGGAWIYSVDSHEELDHLLAASPAYNHATYQVLPLAEMEEPTVLRGGEGGS
jgi:muconolactone delta-isomerase